MDNTLAFIDQASFAWVRASGHVHAIQCIWVYERAIDIDGLGRLRDNLAHGLLGRRVERSPLPFGRHRWVSCQQAPEIDIAQPIGSPDGLAGWADERARLPVDPELGPHWHIGVLPIEGYGTAVSLVASHTVVDALGLCFAMTDAAKGITHDLGYPLPSSRPRRRALIEDARLTARGLPEVAHAIVAVIKLARRPRPKPARSSAPSVSSRRKADSDRPVVVPTATLYVDLADWDARAESLGGTSNSLFAGFAARLAERIGRVRAGDGRVTLAYPVNDRTEGDLRANALKSVDFTVDPTPVTTDLQQVRENIKEALTLGLGVFKEQEAVLPLTPLVPKVLVRRLATESVGTTELPVGCSNIGHLDPALACADGTAADRVSLRLVEQNLTEKSPELKYGELALASGRICGQLFITFRAYQGATQDSKDDLCELITSALADFHLTGTIE
ncbi:MAG: hypothetical protein JWR37_5850 [Mycobacterium sp.]|nr:hypothetical protein [Mycobacterium sp.]